MRKKYNIDIGDLMQAIPAEEGILLIPAPKSKGNSSVTDNLFGIFEKYAREKEGLDKKEIIEATKKGFVEGWSA